MVPLYAIPRTWTVRNGPKEDHDEAAREHKVVDQAHPWEREGALEEELAGGADLWCGVLGPGGGVGWVDG